MNYYYKNRFLHFTSYINNTIQENREILVKELLKIIQTDDEQERLNSFKRLYEEVNKEIDSITPKV